MITRGRGSRSGAPNSADLLVCFPSRAHLTLMPKPICSPETNKLHGLSNKSQLKRVKGRGGGYGSPKLWAKTKAVGQEEMDEPSSPKVTCAGQVRVRPSAARASCKNWHSVMEEIERIHKKGRTKTKKPSWMEALGLKKDVMQFLTCLRSLRLDFRCFGSLPAGADITSDEDEEEEEEEGHVDEDDESSRTVFSKWFMVLQENQNKGFSNMEEKEKIQEGEEAACAPPPNALLLMRCRSAPAKSWLEEKEEKNDEHENEDDEDEEEEDEEKKKEKLVLMRYDTEYYKISGDIAKETWVVGGSMGDELSRSRSWKR